MRLLCLLAITVIFSMPVHVTPSEFQGHSCTRIIKAMRSTSREAVGRYQQLKRKADKQAYRTGLGAAGLWPLLLFREPDGGPDTQAYVAVKAEYVALRRAAIRKQCDTSRLPRSPQSIINEMMAEEKRQGDWRNPEQQKFLDL